MHQYEAHDSRQKYQTEQRQAYTDKHLLTMCSYIESYVICTAVMLPGLHVACPGTSELGREKMKRKRL